MPPRDPVARFHAALAGGAVPPGLLASPADEVQARLSVYRNTVARSLALALAQRFPVVERLVGPAFFAAMAVPFRAAHPPRSPVLQEWGGDFPGFLAGFPPVAGLPYLPDVARIEWARGLAYHAADAGPLAADQLAEALAGGGPLRLHPSLLVLRLDQPAVSIWQANQPGRDGACRAAGPEIALIWRRPDHQVPVARIAPGEAALIDALLRGVPLEDALAAVPDDGAGDPTALLALLIRDALICDPFIPDGDPA